jgi:folate-binding protein YgfZ
MSLHEFHQGLHARFGEVGGCEVVDSYGDALVEHATLREAAGVMDLSFRGRLCVTGADRQRFLNGQVTNNVKDLAPGQGCYAALVTAKGKLESDLNIHCLRDELLLDFEPGLAARVRERLERYLVADDAQIVDVTPHYGLLAVLGPKSAEAINKLGLDIQLPASPLTSIGVDVPDIGEVVIVNHARGAAAGFDLFIPTGALAAVTDKLIAAAKELGGRACGWRALEMIRIEAGLPRFGADMDETNLAPEAGIESRAISYTKGCYIGQEIINRLRTFAQVTKSMRGLRLADDLKTMPARGDKLLHEGKQVGHITSALASPALHANIALGYVRREHIAPGTELTLRTAAGDSVARVVALPFSR